MATLDNAGVRGFQSNLPSNVDRPDLDNRVFSRLHRRKFFIFGKMNNSSNGEYFICHLTLGFMMWTFTTNAIVGGVNGFVSSKNWIHGVNAPYSIFLFENMTNGLLNLGFVAIASMMITMYFQPFGPQQFLIAVAGMVLVVFSFFWVSMVLAVIGVFFRDVIQLVITIMRIAFFLTPILWLPGALGTRAAFVNWNPFTHYLALVRAPLIDGSTPMLSIIVVLSIGIIAMILALVSFSFTRKYIPSHI